jgi:hypothetical protein
MVEITLIRPAGDRGKENLPNPRRDHLIEIIDSARSRFAQSRRDRYRALIEAADGFGYKDDPFFDEVCEERQAKGDHPETRMIDMIAPGLSKERRAEYAAAMCGIIMLRPQWGESPHDDTEINEFIDEIISKGGVTAIAADYRRWATKNLPAGGFGSTNPETIQRAQATKASGLEDRAATAHAKPRASASQSNGQGRRAAAPPPIDRSKLSQAANAQIDEKIAKNGFGQTEALMEFAELHLANCLTHVSKDIEFLDGFMDDDDEFFVAALIVTKRKGEKPLIYGPALKDEGGLIRRVIRQIEDETM